jgi:hypothetical protein
MDNTAELLVTVGKARYLAGLEGYVRRDFAVMRTELADDPRCAKIAIEAYTLERIRRAPEDWQPDVSDLIARLITHSTN